MAAMSGVDPPRSRRQNVLDVPPGQLRSGLEQHGDRTGHVGHGGRRAVHQPGVIAVGIDRHFVIQRGAPVAQPAVQRNAPRPSHGVGGEQRRFTGSVFAARRADPQVRSGAGVAGFLPVSIKCAHDDDIGQVVRGVGDRRHAADLKIQRTHQRVAGVESVAGGLDVETAQARPQPAAAVRKQLFFDQVGIRRTRAEPAEAHVEDVDVGRVRQRKCWRRANR